ncbi:MAG: RNA degradosome polyphosphate kinase [Paludibacteraceae bacterium]
MKKKIKSKFVNREISWLHFNNRVLQEAANADVPLVERLKFLGIYSNNMDEFFRVRVATLKRMLELNVQSEEDKDDPDKILKKIAKITATSQSEMENIFFEIKERLREQKIFFVDETQLTDEQKKFVKIYYDKYLEDAITPILLNEQTIPELRDARLYLIVRLTNSKKADSRKYALIEFPGSEFSRFLELPDTQDGKYLILLDDVIRLSLPLLFKCLPYDMFEAYTFKITRDSEMEIVSEMGEGIVEKVSKGVKSRRFGSPLRLVYDSAMPEEMKKHLIKRLDLKKSAAILPGGRYHNFKDFIGFPSLGVDTFVYKEPEPIENKIIARSNSVIEAIERQDLFLHYPYYSFSQYVQLLREAAISPDVSSIKITIYRMAHKSKVAKALIFAAKNGKKVTAVVELRARFDEEHNIQWAQRMQDAGVNVVFGIEGLKIHSKLTLIKMKNGKKVAAISTGNFHEGNAAVYTDFTLFTANQQITNEVERVFDFIDQPFQTQRFSHLLVSPQEMRKKLNLMVQHEIANAKKGLPAYIYCKINHITDYKFIEKLYNAAECGVKIKLIVRGMCAMVPTLEKLKGNIKIISVVDKYLEHSRIFLFCNNEVEKYFVSSADWMTRNLDRRIEVAVPIYSKTIQRELKTILDYVWNDNVKARVVDGSGENEFRINDKTPFRSQFELMEYYKNRESD